MRLPDRCHTTIKVFIFRYFRKTNKHGRNKAKKLVYLLNKQTRFNFEHFKTSTEQSTKNTNIEKNTRLTRSFRFSLYEKAIAVL